MALIKPKKPAAAEPEAPASLTDPDPSVRRRAALALAGQAAAVPQLADRLTAETDPSVREVLLTALVRTGTPDAAAALVPLLDSENAALRNAAIESLQQMPADSAAPVLLPLLEDPDSDRRLFAVQLLGRLAHPGRIGWLTGVVEREAHVNVCLAAVEALAESGAPETLPALEGLAVRFPDDPFVAFSRDAARRRFAGG